MTLSPRLRRLTLTAHITASVAWIGAVLVFLALGTIGLTSGDAGTVRSSYVVMHPLAQVVLLPLALASLITGLAQSLGTHWGLFRHYWTAFKLLINLFATILLLAYLSSLDTIAARAADPALPLADLRDPSPLLHAALALLLLLAAVVLGVYKPRGLIPNRRTTR